MIVDAFERDPEAELLYGQVERSKAPESVSMASVPNSGSPAKKLNTDRGFRISSMGANFAARRTIFERIGGFDEALGAIIQLESYQDYDFQYRVYLAGATMLLRAATTVSVRTADIGAIKATFAATGSATARSTRSTFAVVICSR